MVVMVFSGVAAVNGQCIDPTLVDPVAATRLSDVQVSTVVNEG